MIEYALIKALLINTAEYLNKIYCLTPGQGVYTFARCWIIAAVYAKQTPIESHTSLDIVYTAAYYL